MNYLQVRNIIWFLIAFWSISCFGGDNFRLADSLFERGEYRIAAIEYERIFFLASVPVVRTEALLRKAECLKHLLQFEKAERNLNRANFAALNDTLIFRVRFQTALCAYLGGNFSNAESQLIQIHYFIKDSIYYGKWLMEDGKREKKESDNKKYPFSIYHHTSYILLYALVLNEQNRWDEAKEKIVKWINLTDYYPSIKDSLLNIIGEIYQSSGYPKLKNLKKAQILSRFLPGSGQIYTGYFWDGLTNVSLQLTALAFTGYAIYSAYYITAFVIGYVIFGKFYVGGINHLKYLVNKKNYELLRGYNNRLKKDVLDLLGDGL